MTNRLLAISFTAVILLGCASGSPKYSDIELREMQTRDFSTNNKVEVYKSVVNALQDEGFQLQLSDSAAGVLTAQSSEITPNKGKIARATVLTVLTNGLWALTLPGAEFGITNTISVSGNVTSIDKQTRVRLNFVHEQRNKENRLVKSDAIVDPKFYREVFIKIEKSLFLEQNL